MEGEGEVVEEVYPSPVQVVQPDQGEPASVVYASSIVESRNEENDAEIEPSENTIDNSDSHVDDVTDDQDVTTESVEFYTYRNVDNVDSNTEDQGEETTLVPEVVVGKNNRVWKYQDFSVIQILREINLNCEQHFTTEIFHKNQKTFEWK